MSLSLSRVLLRLTRASKYPGMDIAEMLLNVVFASSLVVAALDQTCMLSQPQSMLGLDMSSEIRPQSKALQTILTLVRF